MHSTLCKIEFTILHCNKSRNEKHGAQAQADFAEILWDQKNTCMELELPPLSSQLHICFIFIVEKRFYSVRKT